MTQQRSDNTDEPRGPAQQTVTQVTDREIISTRVFNAPRELVFSMWTDPRHIANWWGPNGFTNTIHEMDVRPGGVWRYTMHGPDGVDYPNRVTYAEVVKPERLTYVHGEDTAGTDTASDLAQFHVTVTFVEQDGKTTITMRMQFPNEAALARVAAFGAIEGNQQTLGRLDVHLLTLLDAPDRTLVIERDFNAPRELVFKAFSSCEHVSHWWPPKGAWLDACSMDFRVGGAWRYCMKGEGFEQWCRHDYHEIVEPERIVYTATFIDQAGIPISTMPVMLTTMTLTETDGRTHLYSRAVFETPAMLEATLAMGVLEGTRSSLDNLDAYLAQG